jgi:hypothetical protein
VRATNCARSTSPASRTHTRIRTHTRLGNRHPPTSKGGRLNVPSRHQAKKSPQLSALFHTFILIHYHITSSRRRRAILCREPAGGPNPNKNTVYNIILVYNIVYSTLLQSDVLFGAPAHPPAPTRKESSSASAVSARLYSSAHRLVLRRGSASAGTPLGSRAAGPRTWLASRGGGAGERRGGGAPKPMDVCSGRGLVVAEGGTGGEAGGGFGAYLAGTSLQPPCWASERPCTPSAFEPAHGARRVIGSHI